MRYVILTDIHGSREDLWQPGSQSESLWYTYRHLTARDLDRFERMPESMVVRHGDAPPVGICHANPASSSASACRVLSKNKL